MTTATVLPAPALTGSGTDGISDGITLTWAELQAELNASDRIGQCHHPVTLTGTITALDTATGELRTMYTTEDEPGRLLRMACGNRRENICPPCAAVYQRDARQLVRAGLTGGKGIPESIAAHPCVFATLTARSFGPVHSRRMRGNTVLPCRPRRDHKERRCPHGRDISCPYRHSDTDPRLGRALCQDCYDYDAAVLFNAHAADLWRRFTTYLPRHLARRAGISVAQLRELARVRYVKVAEYQARGVVHFHAVIRLDAPGDDYQPPPDWLNADMLADAIAAATQAASLTVPVGDHHAVVRFGQPQGTDVRIIRRAPELPGSGRALSAQAVANYIAKYATKAATVPGLPDRPLRYQADIMRQPCSAHHKQMMTAAWALAAATRRDRIRSCAHQLGWGGHFLTKSRRYSVTFSQLRRARLEHRRRQHYPDGESDPWGRPLDDTVVLVLKTWAYQGTEHNPFTGSDLALASAARARDHDDQDQNAD
jgi:hypothetical protein